MNALLNIMGIVFVILGALLISGIVQHAVAVVEIVMGLF